MKSNHFFIPFFAILAIVFIVSCTPENIGPDDLPNDPMSPGEWRYNSTEKISPLPYTPPSGGVVYVGNAAVSHWESLHGAGSVNRIAAPSREDIDKKLSALRDSIQAARGVLRIGYDYLLDPVQVRYKDMFAVITSTSNAFSYDTLSVVGNFWRQKYQDQKLDYPITLVNAPGSLSQVYTENRNLSGGERMWFIELDVATGDVIDINEHSYSLPELAALGLPERTHAVYYAANNPEYFLWQLNWQTSDIVLHAEDRFNGDFPCFAVNGVESVITTWVNGITWTANGPQGQQSVSLANSQLGGNWVQVPVILVVGEESYALPALWAPPGTSGFTQMVIQMGTELNSSGAYREIRDCWQ